MNPIKNFEFEHCSASCCHEMELSLPLRSVRTQLLPYNHTSYHCLRA